MMNTTTLVYILWIISNIAFATKFASYYAYISTPLSYNDAETFCQSNYNTNLATIITEQDRLNAIEAVNDDSALVWNGLKNSHKSGWWKFSEPNIECPNKFSGACVDFWVNGKPRCHKTNEPNHGFQCTEFYVFDNMIDNNIDCQQVLPFLCNNYKQNNYSFETDLPVPGELYQIEDGSGYIRLSENTKYLHESHTLKCMIEYDDNSNILNNSFVEITKEMYDIADVNIDSILLATMPMIDLLPLNCSRDPALKVTDVDIFSNSVVLYVTRATLFEYITEMDINGSNYTMYYPEQKPQIIIPDVVEQFLENNISNGTFIVSQLGCAVYDTNGILIENVITDPVDGKCYGKTVFDEFGGLLDESGNNTSRRLFIEAIAKTVKKGWNWTKKKVIKPAYNLGKKGVMKVYKFGKTIVDIVKGDVELKKTLKVLDFDATIMYSLLGTQVKKKFVVGHGVSITPSGTFEIDAGLKFKYEIYAELHAKYKIWTTNPSFNYFKLEFGQETEFEAWFYMKIKGGVRIEYKLGENEKEGSFAIGPIPVWYRLHGDMSIGIDITQDINMKGRTGYEPIYMKYGVEYIKGTGWQSIKDDNTKNIVPIKHFESEATNAEDCWETTVAPYIALRMGVEFYKVVDVFVRMPLSFPATLSFPGTCNSIGACYHNPKQLKHELSFKIAVSLHLDIAIEEFGFKLAALSWPIFSRTLSIADWCNDAEGDIIASTCCGPTTTTSTKSPNLQCSWYTPTQHFASTPVNCPPPGDIAYRLEDKTRDECYDICIGSKTCNVIAWNLKNVCMFWYCSDLNTNSIQWSEKVALWNDPFETYLLQCDTCGGNRNDMVWAKHSLYPGMRPICSKPNGISNNILNQISLENCQGICESNNDCNSISFGNDTCYLNTCSDITNAQFIEEESYNLQTYLFDCRRQCLDPEWHEIDWKYGEIPVCPYATGNLSAPFHTPLKKCQEMCITQSDDCNFLSYSKMKFQIGERETYIITCEFWVCPRLSHIIWKTTNINQTETTPYGSQCRDHLP
eukprot:359642_1